jgi:hypothetical protein
MRALGIPNPEPAPPDTHLRKLLIVVETGIFSAFVGHAASLSGSGVPASSFARMKSPGRGRFGRG